MDAKPRKAGHISAMSEVSNTKRKVGRPTRRPDPRNDILRAGLSLFAERGFDATSIGDIAEAAGMAKPNVLYYFPSKDEIWKTAIDLQWAEINAFYAARLPDPMPATKAGLRILLETFIDACRTFPPYTRIPALEGNAETWRTAWLADRHLAAHVARAKSYLRALSDAGITRQIDPLVVQMLMGGMGHVYFGQIALWERAARKGGGGAVAAKFVDAMLELLLANRGAAISDRS